MFTAPLRSNERSADHTKHSSLTVARLRFRGIMFIEPLPSSELLRLSGVMSQYFTQQQHKCERLDMLYLRFRWGPYLHIHFIQDSLSILTEIRSCRVYYGDRAVMKLISYIWIHVHCSWQIYRNEDSNDVGWWHVSMRETPEGCDVAIPLEFVNARYSPFLVCSN
jgi:hypothetical protein